MQVIKLSEATAAYRKFMFFAFDDDSADSYAPKTGLTFSAGELRWKKAGVADANAAGTATELGGGWYEYEATAGECDTLGVALLRTNKTDVYSEGTPVQIVAYNPMSSVSLGLSNLDATVSSRLPTSTYEAPSTLLSYASGIDTGLTLKSALQAIFATTAGRRSGVSSGIELFRNYPNTGNTISMTYDASGNTTAVTYTFT
jgi:hypothetical protein